ncbi:MAG: TlpA disulfide reductase family protein [Chloroflexota bacterium]
MSDLSTARPATEGQTAVKKNRFTTLFMWLAIALILGLSGWGLINNNRVRPEAGQAAPDFDMQFFNGYEWENATEATLADMRGKVIVLNFWASWCVECRVEADLLEQRWQQYRDQGVVFLGIAYVDAEPNSLAYLQEFNVTYPNAPDLGTDIAQNYEITGVPETFFIGRDGQIAHVQIGPVSERVLDGVIGQLIQE